MKIIVTGGKGFIGTHLVNKLKALDHEVTVVDSRGGKLVQELRDDDLKGYDVIFHLAATARVGISLNFPEETLSNNINSTLLLLDHCRKYPSTQLIFASSSSAAFADVMQNPYAMSKRICEDLIEMYRKTYGVKGTIVRFFNVYGPGEADYGPHTTLIKQCKKGYLNGMGFYITGDGSIVRDFTHVYDVVAGLARILDCSQFMEQHRFELGSTDATVSVKDIVEEFQKGTDLRIRHRKSRPGDPPKTCASKDAVPEGWEPKVKVLEYIRQWKACGCPAD